MVLNKFLELNLVYISFENLRINTDLFVIKIETFNLKFFHSNLIRSSFSSLTFIRGSNGLEFNIYYYQLLIYYYLAIIVYYNFCIIYKKYSNRKIILER